MKKLLPLLLLISCSSCSRHIPANRPLNVSSNTIIGYTVPGLPGWQGSIYSDEKGFAHFVTYKKSIGNNRSIIKFSVIKPVQGFPPETIATLRKFEDNAEKMSQELDPTTVTLQRREINYKGHLGITVKTSSKNTEFTTLRVADGTNTIVFSKSLIGETISQEARKEVESAWQKLLSGAKLPEGR